MTVVDPSESSPGTRAAARKERVAGWRVGVLASPAAPVYGALIGIIVLAWIVVTIDGGEFLTTGNIVNMLQRSVALGIVSLGQTVVILLGSLDLSVAALISLSSLVTAQQMDGQPGNVIPAILIVLAMGAGVGLANGLIITKLRVNAFIATLGMALILGGIIENGWSGPQGGVTDAFSQDLGYTRFGVIPMSFILFAVVAVVIWFILRSTRFGYRVYAVGGSEDVSKLSGLRTHRTIIGAHIVCSLTAVITGIFLASRLKAGTPTVGLDGGYDLESIAAVVLGGTALTGGRGGVIGTIGGVFILAVLDNVFNQLEFNSFVRDVVRGIVIIAAVAIYARRQEKKA
ncbi:ABC transporter permease [Solirubrobacter phytolaccae]|uniref:Autoinducer 2 import system permease protein LsrD n=1 Tax=Solirubrobacter phytolaccae TaxID=1404360 RepID=A0A9X3N8X8_9ACTN|nr:ABC transporter permease [Solirubrobacter phytolaccae]MDA0180594.1 ABC transporter permease [Solirubrobacter phytolaccae]